jgi:hypothetical protein
MRQKTPSFTIAHKIGSLLLMLALLWLSVSTPYVYRFQQKVKAEKQAQTNAPDEDSEGSLNNNINEEKSESGPNTLQEYLHEPLHLEHPSLAQVNEYGHFEQKASIAYHPELISPPPEA